MIEDKLRRALPRLNVIRKLPKGSPEYEKGLRIMAKMLALDADIDRAEPGTEAFALALRTRRLQTWMLLLDGLFIGTAVLCAYIAGKYPDLRRLTGNIVAAVSLGVLLAFAACGALILRLRRDRRQYLRDCFGNVLAELDLLPDAQIERMAKFINTCPEGSGQRCGCWKCNRLFSTPVDFDNGRDEAACPYCGDWTSVVCDISPLQPLDEASLAELHDFFDKE